MRYRSNVLCMTNLILTRRLSRDALPTTSSSIWQQNMTGLSAMLNSYPCCCTPMMISANECNFGYSGKSHGFFAVYIAPASCTYVRKKFIPLCETNWHSWSVKKASARYKQEKSSFNQRVACWHNFNLSSNTSCNVARSSTIQRKKFVVKAPLCQLPCAPVLSLYDMR